MTKVKWSKEELENLPEWFGKAYREHRKYCFILGLVNFLSMTSLSAVSFKIIEDIVKKNWHFEIHILLPALLGSLLGLLIFRSVKGDWGIW